MSWQALSDEARNGQRVLLHGGTYVSGGTEIEQADPVLATWDGSEWIIAENTGPKAVIRHPTHWCMLPPVPRGGEFLASIRSGSGTELQRRALACLRRWDWRRKGCLAGNDVARELGEDVFVTHEAFSELERLGYVEQVGVTPTSGFVWRERLQSEDSSVCIHQDGGAD